MLPVYPESPSTPELVAEISAMNREFLGLLTHPLVVGYPQLLGLDSGVISSLRRLNDNQLKSLAQAPLLLADFELLRGAGGGSGRQAFCVAENSVPGEWQDCVLNYANRLLTSLWHYSRQPDGITGFCVGLDQRTAGPLAAMNFSELCDRADAICASLHARHAEHPVCWPDLVSSARCEQPEKLSAAQLRLIPLTVAENFST